MSVAAEQWLETKFVPIDFGPKEDGYTEGDGKKAGSGGSSSLAVAVEVPNF